MHPPPTTGNPHPASESRAANRNQSSRLRRGEPVRRRLRRFGPPPRPARAGARGREATCQSGVIVLCGGLGGVMESVAEGAASAGGMVVGILPGADRMAANPYLTLAIATGLGEARNAVLTAAADAVIAIGGGWGTLSEIALARKRDRPVVALASWELEGVPVAVSAEAAVRAAIGR